MCAAACDTQFDDGSAAARAWLAIAPEHIGKGKVTAPLALGIDIVFIS